MMIWIKNKLKILGEIDTFMKDARGYPPLYESEENEFCALLKKYQIELPERTLEEFCFHSLIPVPKKVLKCGNPARHYDWEIKNWGCRGIVARVKVNQCLEGIIYEFDTLDQQPIKLVERITKKYPFLSFELC